MKNESNLVCNKNAPKTYPLNYFLSHDLSDTAVKTWFSIVRQLLVIDGLHITLGDQEFFSEVLEIIWNKIEDRL